jgi:hypothetical protein
MFKPEKKCKDEKINLFNFYSKKKSVLILTVFKNLNFHQKANKFIELPKPNLHLISCSFEFYSQESRRSPGRRKICNTR